MQLAIGVFLSVVTVLFWGVCSSHATVWQVNTAQTLQSALNSAVAGDEIVLADGIYNGKFYIQQNAGISNQPITIRAANRHQAVLMGDNVCNRNHEGLVIQQAWWIIKDLRFQNHGRAITVYAANVEIHDNIIAPFREEGIRVESTSNANIHRNVFFGTTCPADSPAIFLYESSNNTVKDNIVFGITDNGYQFGDKTGYGILVASNSNDNLIQGNLVMQDGKAPLRILGNAAGNTADRNIARDNMILFGKVGFRRMIARMTE